MYFIYLLLFYLITVQSSYGENDTNTDNNVADVSHITEILLTFLGQNGKNDSNRIQELQQKLAKIDSYVVDKEKYNSRLFNESRDYFLNSTNFYLALNDQDHFRLLNDTRNLYIKLKEKINREDLLQILAERGNKKMRKSARRIMQRKSFSQEEKVLDDIVDKYLGESACDDHKYNAENTYNKYWDPDPELQERQSFYRPSGRRIFKGERTNIKFYPFMVSIHIMGRFWCGGVLYWHDLILTSAACLQLLHNNRFYRENPKVLAVRVGSNHSRFGGEMIPALEVYFHPSYKPKTLENNIALIRLERFLKFSYHRVPKLISLSYNDKGVPFTAEVLLLGWGVRKLSQRNSYEPAFLSKKVLPVYPSKFCKEIYGEKFNMRTMFCAGTVTTGEGACNHDAGGPAILSGQLVGIISYGPTICGYPDAPTVLTLVGAFSDWIETINETIPSYVRGKKSTTTTTQDPLWDFFSTTYNPLFDAKKKYNKKRKTATVGTRATVGPAVLREQRKPVYDYLAGVEEELNKISEEQPYTKVFDHSTISVLEQQGDPKQYNKISPTNNLKKRKPIQSPLNILESQNEEMFDDLVDYGEKQFMKLLDRQEIPKSEKVVTKSKKQVTGNERGKNFLAILDKTKNDIKNKIKPVGIDRPLNTEKEIKNNFKPINNDEKKKQFKPKEIKSKSDKATKLHKTHKKDINPEKQQKIQSNNIKSVKSKKAQEQDIKIRASAKIIETPYPIEMMISNELASPEE